MQWVATSHPSHIPPGNIAPRPRLNSKLGGSESRSGRFKQETNILLLPGFHKRLFGYTERSRFTVGLQPGWSLSLTIKTRVLSLNKTQSGVVFGLCIGHYNLRRYFYWMRLTNSPIYRRCGAEEETSAHVLCKCDAWCTYLGSFSWTEGMFRDSKSGGHLELQLRNRDPMTWHQIMGHKGPI